MRRMVTDEEIIKLINEHGGAGSIDAAELKNLLEGSEDVVVDLNPDQSKVEVHLDQHYKDTLALKSDLGAKQDTLTAGANITIEGNVISASGGSVSDVTKAYVDEQDAKKQDKLSQVDLDNIAMINQYADDISKNTGDITALKSGKLNRLTVTMTSGLAVGNTFQIAKADVLAADTVVLFAGPNDKVVFTVDKKGISGPIVNVELLSEKWRAIIDGNTFEQDTWTFILTQGTLPNTTITIIPTEKEWHWLTDPKDERPVTINVANDFDLDDPEKYRKSIRLVQPGTWSRDALEFIFEPSNKIDANNRYWKCINIKDPNIEAAQYDYMMQFNIEKPSTTLTVLKIKKESGSVTIPKATDSVLGGITAMPKVGDENAEVHISPEGRLWVKVPEGGGGAGGKWNSTSLNIDLPFSAGSAVNDYSTSISELQNAVVAQIELSYIQLEDGNRFDTDSSIYCNVICDSFFGIANGIVINSNGSTLFLYLVISNGSGAPGITGYAYVLNSDGTRTLCNEMKLGELRYYK